MELCVDPRNRRLKIMVDEPKPSLRDSLLLLTEDAAFYFDAAAGVVPDDETYKESFTYPSRNEADIFWNDLPESLQTQSRELVKRVIAFAAQLAPVLKSSPLNSEADQRVLMIGTKAMRSALRLRRFRYEDMQVLHDEGTVLGVQPASESDNEPLYPKGAEQAFTEWVSRFIEIIQLVEAGDALSKPSNRVIVASQN